MCIDDNHIFSRLSLLASSEFVIDRLRDVLTNQNPLSESTSSIEHKNYALFL